MSLTNVLIDTHVTTKTSKIFLYPRKLPSALSQPLVPSPQSPQAEAPSVLISVTIAYYCLFWNLLDIFLCVWLLLLSTVFEMCRCYLILTASPVQTVLHPVYRWGDWGSDNVEIGGKVTQLVDRCTGTGIQVLSMLSLTAFTASQRTPGHCFSVCLLVSGPSKCDPWTSIAITQDLVKNGDSWAHPRAPESDSEKDPQVIHRLS